MKNTEPIATARPETRKQYPKSPLRRRVDYLISIIINVILLYVANNLLNWRAQLITQDWATVLPTVNMMLGVTLAINVLFLFYDPRLFFLIGRNASDLVSLYVTYRVWHVFPFDFHGFFGLGWLNPVVKTVLPIACIGLLLAVIIRSVRYVSHKNIYY
ncbi:MAG: hypothetical protein WC544_00700 [Patescibacteria group bacterium]